MENTNYKNLFNKTIKELVKSISKCKKWNKYYYDYPLRYYLIVFNNEYNIHYNSHDKDEEDEADHTFYVNLKINGKTEKIYYDPYDKYYLEDYITYN